MSVSDWKPTIKKEEAPSSTKKQAERGFGYLTNTKEIRVNSGSLAYRVNNEGLFLGAEQFDNAPFRVDMTGNMVVQRITMDNFVVCNNSSITYTGTWSLESVNTLMGGKRYVSSTVGDYFTFDFSGTSVGVIFEKAGNVGKINIYIDDVFQETVDLYSTTLLARSVVWKITTLSNGEHTFKGVVETKNVSSTSNQIGFQGYTLFPNEGIKLESLSAELYTYSTSITTNAQGYATSAISAPTGYVVYNIVGAYLSTQRMSKKVGDTTSQWDVTNPAGTTIRYTWDGTGTSPSFASLSNGTSSVIISGFNAVNNGTFTVDTVASTYFEVTNAGGTVESNITNATIINNNATVGTLEWGAGQFYLYNAQQFSSHAVAVTLLLSKL